MKTIKLVMADGVALSGTCLTLTGIDGGVVIWNAQAADIVSIEVQVDVDIEPPFEAPLAIPPDDAPAGTPAPPPASPGGS